MKKYMIDLDMSRCIACGACAIACMDQNDIDVEAGVTPFRKVFDTEQVTGSTLKFGHFSVGCMHCEDAPCISACPCACLKKDPETGFTVYDTTNCIGCHSCAMACPFGVPGFDINGKMIKCNGCFTRVHEGLLPACVKTCPVHALKLIEVGSDSPISEENSLQKAGNPVLKAQV